MLPDSRRRGVGEALTRAACERLRERGADTVLLFATDMGRPLYERLGFEHEDTVTAWRGTAGTARADVTLRVLREEDRGAVRDIDRAATDEDRGPVIDALVPLSGLIAERRGEAAGWAVTSPWGAGVAICARDETAGVALLAAAAGGPGSNTIVVPDRNPAAGDALGRWGFAPTAAGTRMRLGPPVAWRARRCSSACSTCSGANAAKTPIPAPALVRSASIDRVWGLIVVGFLVVAVLGFVAGRVVEARRWRRGERAKRARWRAEAVAEYVETQSRSTTLEERITAERVADVLADVAARTAATTRPSERDDLEIARLARDRRR